MTPAAGLVNHRFSGANALANASGSHGIVLGLEGGVSRPSVLAEAPPATPGDFATQFDAARLDLRAPTVGPPPAAGQNGLGTTREPNPMPPLATNNAETGTSTPLQRVQEVFEAFDVAAIVPMARVQQAAIDCAAGVPCRPFGSFEARGEAAVDYACRSEIEPPPAMDADEIEPLLRELPLTGDEAVDGFGVPYGDFAAVWSTSEAGLAPSVAAHAVAQIANPAAANAAHLQRMVEFAAWSQHGDGSGELRLRLVDDALGGAEITLRAFGGGRVAIRLGEGRNAVADEQVEALVESLQARGIEVVELHR